MEDLLYVAHCARLRDIAVKKGPHLLSWIFRQKENHGTFSWHVEDQPFPVAHALFYLL